MDEGSRSLAAIVREAAPFIAAAIVVLVLAIQVIIALARIKSTLYTITNQRVIIETGIVSKSVEDIDLRTERYINVNEEFLVATT